ncbi:hypothetical protein [Methylomicrobium sp. Wu6]|uniref:hypothetical protein n=1 Tax=Methylomicrobium sp. Wu6 TaxID=3107928 RepID=UPI002DD68FB4|nr:hypothetical protein [Methylomicrobium sp. Wu6]MEC4748963.1 hypothetical protein [Methylomicrobium sp. Wu6]
MNGFLQNMIDRHQGVASTVQPRQRAMFEPEAAVADHPAVVVEAGLAESYPAAATATERTNIAVAERIKPSIQESRPAAIQATTDAQNKPESLRHPLPEDHRHDQTDLRIQDILSRVPTNQFTDNPHSGLDTTAESRDLTGRIEEILDRLVSQSAVTEPMERGNEDVPRLAPAALVGNENALFSPFSFRPPSHRNETSVALTETSTAPAQTPDKNRQEPGTLQIPTWLQDLQTSLGERSQEISGKAEAEPVINVTIGRIEIRATKADAAPPAPKPGKPSGLLSLDDYLKQRNGGRRS